MTIRDANNTGGGEKKKNHRHKTGRYTKDFLILFDTQVAWQQVGGEE